MAVNIYAIQAVLDVFTSQDFSGNMSSMREELGILPHYSLESSVLKDFFAGLRDLLFDQGGFLVEIDAEAVIFAMLNQLFQLVLQLQDRLLEIQLMFHDGAA